MTPLTLILLLIMLGGPLLQGLSGASNPNAILFAPIIAVATLPLQRQRDMRGGLILAGLFLAIGAACLGLWWIGGQIGPRAVPGWAPLAVTVLGALAALFARHRP